MLRPQPSLATLHRPLPVDFECCLAATAFFLWCLAGSFQVQIGIHLQQFGLVVETPRWQPQWPVLPWLLAVGGLALAYARHRWGDLTPDQTLRLVRQLRQLTLLVGTLLMLRLFTLWSPLTSLFPYLTLLWSPHPTWALGAAFLLFPQAGLLPALSTRRLTLVLLTASAFVFSLWALYFCQMTMLHGDEAHYLRVTQSLLHDGDMDLSNNLGAAQAKEYHVIDFQPHKAPGSPPGRIHSIHPIGLSALLVPAYWTGLQLWANPRLACSLSIALMSAGAITLAFLWLVRLGFNQWHALACVLVIASTTPFFPYTTQLYPDIPALLVALLGLALLTHWQSPTPRYQSLGNREPLLLVALALLLIGLLFLHPRYLPLAAFLGVGLGLQVRHSPQRRRLLRWCLPVGGAGALALLAFNYDYSGDLFGPFLPGNAWDSGALQGSTLLLSLPGQWLHRTTGLLNSSPVFLASILGLAWLAFTRDRRARGVLAFYLVTTGVNGLHPDWTFGFCPPARYLLTATPVLLFGLALFVEAYASRLLPLFGLLFALALSYDSVARLVAMPEQAYGGNHLAVRKFVEYYPWDAHFFPQATGSLPWADLFFWGAASAGLAAALSPRLSRSWRWASLLAAGLLPCIWGQTGVLAERLTTCSSAYLLRLNPSGLISPETQVLERPIKNEYQSTTGTHEDKGSYAAQGPQNQAGILQAFYGPLIQPGMHSFFLSEVRTEHAPGQVAGHFVVCHRQTLPAISDWGVFHALPLATPGPGPATATLSFLAGFTGLDYPYVEFSGVGSLSFLKSHTLFFPIHVGDALEEIRRLPGSSGKIRCENLEKGYYVARYNLKGAAFDTFFERKPTPVFIAVYTGRNSPPGAPPLEAQATRWLESYYPMHDQNPRPDFVRPLVESIQAPWWTAMPLVGASAYELEFGLSQAQDVWLLFDYPGKAGLTLENITLYRKELPTVGPED